MYRNPTNERYYEALRRLAVLLLTLAVLSERAASRSWLIRWIKLSALGKAEIVASDFAAKIWGGALPRAHPVRPLEDRTPTVHGDLSAAIVQQEHRAHPTPARTPMRYAETARLADRFRALAAVFFFLSCQAPQWLRIGWQHSLDGSCRHATASGTPSFVQRQSYADTS